MKFSLSATALLMALCVVVPTSTFAQSTNSGDIRGTVTDNTGAAIPGAMVTLTDVDKAVTKTLTTDGAGLYDTGSIVPDHYTLTFTKSGFQTLIRGPITVEVGVQGINAQLQVGAQSVEVTVNTDVPSLETESGAQERTLTLADDVAAAAGGRRRLGRTLFCCSPALQERLRTPARPCSPTLDRSPSTAICRSSPCLPMALQPHFR